MTQARRTCPLDQARKIWNIDGTEHWSGMLHQYTDLEVQTGSEIKVMRFLVTDLGLEDMIFWYPWLAAFEPHLHWKSVVLNNTYLPVIIKSLDQQEREQAITIAHALLDNQKKLIEQQLNLCSHIYATIPTELAQKAGQCTKAVAIPPYYQNFSKVFSEQEAQCFPPSQPWDHAIELKKVPLRWSIAKSTQYCQKKMKTFKNGSRNKPRKGKFNHQSPHMHLSSSLSKRRMGSSAQFRTINGSMSTPLRTNTHPPDHRAYCSGKRHPHFYQIQHQMGLQQCLYQERQ